MFRKYRHRSRRQAGNAAMNWIILGMVALAFTNHFLYRTDSSLPEMVKDTADRTMLDLKDYRNRILPPQPLALTLQDLRLGEGAPAVCGQTATLAYQAYGSDGGKLNDSATAEAPYRFTIGAKKALPAFEEGVVGMQKGGIRRLHAPPRYAYGAPGFDRGALPVNDSITFEAQLLDLSPALPDPAQTSFRFIEAQRGFGPVIPCGEAARVHITVWSTEGRKLFTSRDAGRGPITVTPGSAAHFTGLEYSVLGMKPHGRRTAVVPPPFQKPLSGAADTLDIPFPGAQTVLVDIEALE